MKKEFITSSSAETKKLGRELGREIIKKKEAVVIGLIGELGGGKTTFIQGLAKGVGVKEKILSPTFIIFRKFKNKKPFYHFDCYRVKEKDLLDLGFKEIISHKNIVVVEWADKIKKIMPQNTIWINFKFINDKTRKIIYE